MKILQQFNEDQNSPEARQFGEAIIALCNKTICQFDQRRAEIGDRITFDAQIISNAMDGLANVYQKTTLRQEIVNVITKNKDTYKEVHDWLASLQM